MTGYLDLDHNLIHRFQTKIFDRYSINKRDGLPWRDSFDAYKVFLSEVMTQQTQVDRVVPKFELFLEYAADFEQLAALDKTTLLTLWSGLGFNSRAIRLQKAAGIITTSYNGYLPQDRTLLMELPGIGPYASASILAFAYNQTAPVVDTNIRRVFIYELGIPESTPRAQLEAIAVTVTPDGRANDRNNALMDYGAIEATAKKTGIKPLSKQSKFAGSRRQARGQILKYLVAHGPTTRSVVKKIALHQDFDRIIQQMKKDGLLSEEGDMLKIG